MVEASDVVEAPLIVAWLLPLAWLMSRRGRQVDDRRRKMKRLLRLASEEAVRVELKAWIVAWIGLIEALILCII